MSSEIVEYINKEAPNAAAIFNEAEAGDSSINVEATSILEVCAALKKSSDFEFNVLQSITGTDYPEYIEVSYILASFTKNTELILKAKLAKENNTDLVFIPSVCSVWRAADFQERECYDMVGVEFEGHPDMRRILCPEDWEGFPLRKDYVVQEVYRGMVVNPSSKVNQADHDFMTNLKLNIEDPKTVLGSWKGHITPELAAKEKERSAELAAVAKAKKAKEKAEADAIKAKEAEEAAKNAPAEEVKSDDDKKEGE